jgi:AcrR family transcriptional regulator
MELFAEHGYAGTTVGDIERAAGLAPRSGALYQYFGGKDDLLLAALEHELGAVDALGAVIEDLPANDARAALTRLAEWNLASLSRRKNLNRFIARDGDRLPQALQKRLYERLVARPYEQITDLLRAALPAAEARRFDVEALALIFVQSMAGYRAMESTFGKVVGDVDDERFVRSWVEVALAVVRDAGAA